MNVLVNNENKTIYSNTISYEELVELAGENLLERPTVSVAYQDGVTCLSVTLDDTVLVKSGMQVTVETRH